MIKKMLMVRFQAKREMMAKHITKHAGKTQVLLRPKIQQKLREKLKRVGIAPLCLREIRLLKFKRTNLTI